MIVGLKEPGNERFWSAESGVIKKPGVLSSAIVVVAGKFEDH